MEQLARSHALARRAKRDAERKAHYERKKAAAAKSVPEPADAPVDAPATTPPTEVSVERHQKKDLLHKSCGNKIAKSGTSGWTPINHRK